MGTLAVASQAPASFGPRARLATRVLACGVVGLLGLVLLSIPPPGTGSREPPPVTWVRALEPEPPPPPRAEQPVRSDSAATVPQAPQPALPPAAARLPALPVEGQDMAPRLRPVPPAVSSSAAPLTAGQAPVTAPSGQPPIDAGAPAAGPSGSAEARAARATLRALACQRTDPDERPADCPPLAAEARAAIEAQRLERDREATQGHTRAEMAAKRMGGWRDRCEMENGQQAQVCITFGYVPPPPRTVEEICQRQGIGGNCAPLPGQSAVERARQIP